MSTFLKPVEFKQALYGDSVLYEGHLYALGRHMDVKITLYGYAGEGMHSRHCASVYDYKVDVTLSKGFDKFKSNEYRSVYLSNAFWCLTDEERRRCALHAHKPISRKSKFERELYAYLQEHVTEIDMTRAYLRVIC